MKIYFAGSIRGGRYDKDLYKELITHLQTYGEVLSEHIGDIELSSYGENNLTDREIHDRDMEWLMDSDLIVAEVTNPSLGVGYEIGRAVHSKKRVLYLYRPQDNKRISAMIAGCPHIFVQKYDTADEGKKAIDDFFKFVQ